jgi:hypothetical protein
MGKDFSVLLIDMSYKDPERRVGGFPTLELAIEFARRRTRDSLEEFRTPGQSNKNLREAWYMWGEDALVVGGDYAGSSEIDFFIENPATPEERDWKAIKKEAGLE